MTILSIETMREKEIFVVHCWRNNKVSSTVIMSLPHRLAKKYQIQAHTNLLAIDTIEGILLKKVEVPNID